MDGPSPAVSRPTDVSRTSSGLLATNLPLLPQRLQLPARSVWISCGRRCTLTEMQSPWTPGSPTALRRDAPGSAHRSADSPKEPRLRRTNQPQQTAGQEPRHHPAGRCPHDPRPSVSEPATPGPTPLLLPALQQRAPRSPRLDSGRAGDHFLTISEVARPTSRCRLSAGGHHIEADIYRANLVVPGQATGEGRDPTLRKASYLHL